MVAIAAVSINGVIGNKGVIPWNCKGDMAFFKKMTWGKNVILGKRTRDLMPKKNGFINLPHRSIYTLSSRHKDNVGIPVQFEEFTEYQINDISQAPEDSWLCGGCNIYFQFLPRCSDLYLTLIHQKVVGDTYFPMYQHLFFVDEVIYDSPEYSIIHYKRRA